jgi:putative ABC transport system permease protein
MTDWGLLWAYMRHNSQRTLYNILMFAVGTALIATVYGVGQQFERSLMRNIHGIDLVVGAKGSPLQLILSTVLHADVATGNIKLYEAEALKKNPMVASIIPIALGDNVQGFRIVGSEPAYLNLYKATLAEGRVWNDEMEAVLGSETATHLGLKVGQTFVGTHGLTAGGESHDEFPYTVTGILQPTGTVMDRLVLTGVESVWHIHEHHHHEAGEEAAEPDHADEHHHEGPAKEEHEHHDEHAHHDDDESKAQSEREVTAVLVQYASPLAIASLPRFINSQTTMQAASPAMEAGRLRQLLGTGSDTLNLLGGILIGFATLGLLIAMAEAVRGRLYDLALMRCLGASPTRLLRLIVAEGAIISFVGGLLGLSASIVGTGLLGNLLLHGQLSQGLGLTWQAAMAMMGGVVGLGVLGSLLPALRIYRMSLPKVLAGK